MDEKKKYRLESFLPWDTASIIQHLEKMARKGWQLEQCAPSMDKQFWETYSGRCSSRFFETISS